MTKKSRTADERYMLCLYEMAKASDDTGIELDRYVVGEKAGLHPKAVDAICKLLVQSNFIKKSGEMRIYLTENGTRLVLRLLEEKH